MPTGQQAIDDTLPALGRDHEVGPAIERVHDTVLTPGGFEGSHHGRADGDHPATMVARFVDSSRGGRRNPHSFRVGELGRFERCHPGVQHERRHADAFVDQPGDDLGRERPTGLGVSALPDSVA